jgi:hypothetical protein
MKIKDHIDKLSRSNTVAGLEIILLGDGKRSINLCILQKKKSIILKKETIHDIEDIKKLKDLIPADAPVVINVNGQGIMHKKVALSENYNDKELLQKVLPNANAKDFYLQQMDINLGSTFISVVRRDAMDELTDELLANKIHIVSCSIGPFCLMNIVSLMENSNESDQSIEIGKYSLQIKNSNIESFKISETTNAPVPFKIGDEEIEGNSIVAYSAGIGYFVPTQTSVKLNIASITGNALEFTEKRLFHSIGLVLLVLFLITLLGNYFLFNHYFIKRTQLEAIVNSQKSAIEKYDTLKTMLEEKRDFLSKAGILSQPKTSFYADQLVKDIPSEMVLSEMNINPRVINVNADDKDMTFTSGVIKVYGACRNSLNLEEWISSIKKKDWVKGLSVLNYNHDRETNLGHFSIEIAIK